jgi:hypothetical protein
MTQVAILVFGDALFVCDWAGRSSDERGDVLTEDNSRCVRIAERRVVKVSEWVLIPASD